MPNLMIKVSNLSKRYRIGMAEKANRSFRETAMDVITSPFRNFWKLHKLTSFKNAKEKDVIWALKNVSFEVNQGEVLGIIGRNGSGKSTLLKILSRITEPTSGYVEIHSKISSLLEVGTGFHPELTGRENIYLNGAILGMRKKEIERKFDDIVAFSEIGKYIDTPVKRFSSGMYVRLAFAVAAHLEPEILLVDEVLAVGDVEFQKKCLGKMGSLAGSGRTVLFISHNMASVKTLCQRTILLNQGKIIEDGPTQRVVMHYLGSGLHTSAERKWDDLINAPGNEIVRLLAVRAKNKYGEVTAEFNIQAPVQIEVEFQVLQEAKVIDSSLLFKNESGLPIFATLNNSDTEWHNRKRPTGRYLSICNIPGNFLNEGTITVTAAITTQPNRLHANIDDAISFHVFDPGPGGARGDYTREWPDSAVRPLLEWRTERV
jgi:lipopolysaccharide transport system ATP-binding protein